MSIVYVDHTAHTVLYTFGVRLIGEDELLYVPTVFVVIGWSAAKFEIPRVKM